jgi:hypothetical protein
MVKVFTRALISQFEAALCMLQECIKKCPPEHWESKIANDSFRQIAYHTLFFFDLYLSQNEGDFRLLDYHLEGGDERASYEPSKGLSREATLAYLADCHDKAVSILADETIETLDGESGFSRLPFSRGELHLHSLRHIQHHVGQLSAFLRKVIDDQGSWWVRDGWRDCH